MEVVHTHVKGFSTSHPLLGPILWVLNIQYFIAQFLVALPWPQPYSVRQNTISDLGNTVCGSYRDGLICSPHHAWMNVSFVALGLSMILGSVLLCRQYSKSAANTVGFWCMGIAGLGTALVGIFPENTISAAHIFGATLPFLVGNLALVILGFTLQIPRPLQYYTRISGIGALVALPLFLTHTYLGLGIGGMERIVAYPQTIWLIVFGVYTIYCHFKFAIIRI